MGRFDKAIDMEVNFENVSFQRCSRDKEGLRIAEAALPAGGRAARLDYSSSQRAITIFTHSLSPAWTDEDIRVNSVAPGAIWTPPIPSKYPGDLA
jgi:NAD(P)-dependent dehydrogenase (short-subunit alcohol dehydrogenase family)